MHQTKTVESPPQHHPDVPLSREPSVQHHPPLNREPSAEHHPLPTEIPLSRDPGRLSRIIKQRGLASRKAVLIDRDDDELTLSNVSWQDIDAYLVNHENSPYRFQLVGGELTVTKMSLIHDALAGKIVRTIYDEVSQLLPTPPPNLEIHTGCKSLCDIW